MAQDDVTRAVAFLRKKNVIGDRVEDRKGYSARQLIDMAAKYGQDDIRGVGDQGEQATSYNREVVPVRDEQGRKVGESLVPLPSERPAQALVEGTKTSGASGEAQALQRTTTGDSTNPYVNLQRQDKLAVFRDAVTQRATQSVMTTQPSQGAGEASGLTAGFLLNALREQRGENAPLFRITDEQGIPTYSTNRPNGVFNIEFEPLSVQQNISTSVPSNTQNGNASSARNNIWQPYSSSSVPAFLQVDPQTDSFFLAAGKTIAAPLFSFGQGVLKLQGFRASQGPLYKDPDVRNLGIAAGLTITGQLLPVLTTGVLTVLSAKNVFQSVSTTAQSPTAGNFGVLAADAAITALSSFSFLRSAKANPAVVEAYDQALYGVSRYQPAGVTPNRLVNIYGKVEGPVSQVDFYGGFRPTAQGQVDLFGAPAPGAMPIGSIPPSAAAARGTQSTLGQFGESAILPTKRPVSFLQSQQGSTTTTMFKGTSGEELFISAVDQISKRAQRPIYVDPSRQTLLRKNPSDGIFAFRITTTTPTGFLDQLAIGNKKLGFLFIESTEQRTGLGLPASTTSKPATRPANAPQESVVLPKATPVATQSLVSAPKSESFPSLRSQSVQQSSGLGQTPFGAVGVASGRGNNSFVLVDEIEQRGPNQLPGGPILISIPAIRLRSNPIAGVGSRSQSTPRTRTTVLQTPASRTTLDTRQQSVVSPAQIVLPRLDSMFAVAQVQIPALRMDQFAKLMQPSLQNPDYDRRSRDDNDGNVRNKKKRQKGFDVYVRRRGIFQRVAVGLGKAAALSAGARNVQNTAAATFKLAESEVDVIDANDRYFEENQSNFYTKSSRQGALFIQRRGFRLGTVGEKREITYAPRRKASKTSKKSKKKFFGL